MSDVVKHYTNAFKDLYFKGSYDSAKGKKILDMKINAWGLDRKECESKAQEILEKYEMIIALIKDSIKHNFKLDRMENKKILDIAEQLGVSETEVEKLIEKQFEENNNFLKNYEGCKNKNVDEQLNIFFSNGKYGYKNRKNYTVIEPVYDEASEFSENFASIRIQDKWGCIDDQGNMVIEPRYDSKFTFKNSIAKVKLNGNWINIDTLGNPVDLKVSYKNNNLPAMFEDSYRITCLYAPLLQIKDSTYLLISRYEDDIYITYNSPSRRLKSNLFNGNSQYIKIGKVKIKYLRQGDFYTKSDIKASGGGSDYGNALIGGLLFGSAGAIIGSRKELKIDTTTTEVDRRQTVLTYNYNHNDEVFVFTSDAYEILIKLVPDREISFIQNEESNKIAEMESNTSYDYILEQIKKLGELRGNGYITEEEFCEKKKKLLAKL